MIHYHKTLQNTACIARSAANIAICRIFLRLVLLWVIDSQGMVTDRHDKYRPRIDRTVIRVLAGLSPSIRLPRSVRTVP